MILTSLRMLAVLTALAGVAYPLGVTAVALVIPHPPPDVGQEITAPRYFHSRPSAVSYDARTSGGTNVGPSNPARQKEPASGSGLDPHITPESAHAQAARVAAARGIAVERVEALVQAHEEGPLFGVFGAPRVHVVRLNQALDRL